MPQASRNPKMIMLANPQSAVAESYRTLRFNLECLAESQNLRTVAVISANPGEGRTTTAINLAIASAQTGKRVVLIDTDLRQPAVHRAFKTELGAGLANYLMNRLDLAEVLRDSYVENLSLITAGKLPPHPSELLTSPRLTALLNELKRSYDLILLDTPASMYLTDARVVSSRSDGVILVAEHGKLKRAAAKKMSEDLTAMQANLLGVVFNKISRYEARTYLS